MQERPALSTAGLNNKARRGEGVDGRGGGGIYAACSFYTHLHTHTHTHIQNIFIRTQTTYRAGRRGIHARTLACLLVSLVGGDEKKADDGKGLAKREEEG